MTHVRVDRVGQKVDLDDLIDTQDVARILGLAHRNTVSEYQAHYEDMPRPVINLGQGPIQALDTPGDRALARRAGSARSYPPKAQGYPADKGGGNVVPVRACHAVADDVRRAGARRRGVAAESIL